MKRRWKRSQKTTNLIGNIRQKLREIGYDGELAIVPILNVYSIIATKDTEKFNVRLIKDTLQVDSTELLKYDVKKEQIRRVFRHKSW